ncbi:MFS transporter [Phenylobacterium sp.]|uniref:MFS transporter n=1 Tax=Phenylobacterium sp. TaxID=1871053 RepID=UPI0025F6CBF8|nr:MFS transporter [Phenylobacterium sp.]
MAHPYAELLKDRDVRVLWSGLSLSAIGSELFRVGAIWLAATMAGADASLLVTAQAAAMLAVSLLAGPLIEMVPRRRFLVVGEIVSAAGAGLVVVAGLTWGLSLPMLVASSTALSAIGVMARPVFLSSLPLVAPGRVREVNGLFDSSVRIAQAAGPFLAALALKVIAPIHLLTVNAVTFLASALAVALVGRRLESGAHPPAAAPGIFRRLARGVRAASGCPGVWSVLIATGIRGGGYALGYTVAVPLLFVQGDVGLPGLAIVMRVGATAEIVSTPLLVLAEARRPLRRLFQGYVMIGVSLSVMGAVAIALAGAPTAWLVAGLAAAAALVGVGNSVATLQITTFFATRLASDDYAAVLRLRMVTIIGSMMAATAAGPWVLHALGPANTILACGAAAAIAGFAGMLGGPARRLGPGFAEPKPQGAQG